ncbi:hypothetical protein GCM10027217_04680 [Pseudomaricurvus hydrocarbonicus]
MPRTILRHHLKFADSNLLEKKVNSITNKYTGNNTPVSLDNEAKTVNIPAENVIITKLNTVKSGYLTRI